MDSAIGVGRLRARVQKELFGLLVHKKQQHICLELFGAQNLLQVRGFVCQMELISLKVVEERRQSRCLSARCEQVFTPAARDASPRPTMLTPD